MPDDLIASSQAAKEMAIEQLQPKKELLYAEAERTRRRQKFNSWDEPEPLEPWITITDWGIDQYFGNAKPVDWLIEGILPKATPGMICSLGGVGKSYLMLDLAMRVAAGPGLGPQFALGGRIPKRGKTVFITSEDSKNAIHRRLNQLLVRGEMESDLQKAKLLDYMWVVPLADTSAGLRTLLTHINGEYRMTDAWLDLCDQVNAIGEVALVVLDPLQALVQADINADPAAAQVFWSAAGKLCAESGATVLATHHMRKDGSREIDGPMSAREAVRGTTSLVDSARFVWAAWLPQAGDRDAVEQVIGEPLGELDMVQAAVVKSNDIGLSATRTFIRDKVSGLLIDRTEQISEELDAHRHLTDEQIGETFGAVSMRWQSGDPFSHHAAAKSRYLGTWMMAHFDITKDAAKEYISEWLAQGRLVKDDHPTIRRALGLRYEP